MDKKGNSKIIWYILFAFITIIMCYLFTVVFFFFISPYNISVKTQLWPFLSSDQLGNIYSEAVVDIKFNVHDDEYFGEVNISTFGVNITKDGYIISTCDKFEGVSQDTQIQIFAKSGQIFDAKLLYCDKNNNLTILKCESENEIKIPFVKIGGIADESTIDLELVALNSQNRKVATGKVTDYNLADAITSVAEGVYRVDHVAERCFSAELTSNFSSGVVFDKKGHLMGFSVGQNSSEFTFMPVLAVKDYLEEIKDNYQNKKSYKNALVESFVGFDSYEVHYFMQESEKNTDKTTFYFNGQNQNYTDDIKYFGGPNQTGYYLFKDLIYNETMVLEAENVITSINLNKTSFQIDCRADLTDLLYKARKGDTITIYYHEIDSLGVEVKSVSLEV